MTLPGELGFEGDGNKCIAHDSGGIGLATMISAFVGIGKSAQAGYVGSHISYGILYDADVGIGSEGGECDIRLSCFCLG